MPIQLIIFLTKTKIFASEINSNGKAETISIKGNKEIRCEGKESIEELIECLYDAYNVDDFADDNFDLVIVESGAVREMVYCLQEKCKGASKLNTISIEKVLPVIISNKNLVKSGEEFSVTFAGQFFTISCNENGVVKVGKARKTEDAIVIEESDFVCLYHFVANPVAIVVEERKQEIEDNCIEDKLRKAEKAHIEGRYEEAFALFLELAANGNGRAMYYIGEYCRQGFGNVVKKKYPDKGFIWHEAGKITGDVLASLNMAYAYPENSTERERICNSSFESVKDLADRGDVIAQSELADLYVEGYGTEKNIEKGKEYLEKSAKEGYSRSAYDLGTIYYNEENYEVAVKWYRKAAEQGNEDAQNMLGICYYHGQGVPQDYSQAVTWYRKASEQGYDWAQYNLGNCYYNGEGVPQDYSQAVEWYRKAAEQGNEDARKKLNEL